MSLDFDWPDLQAFIEGIQTILQLVFGDQVPPWMGPLVGWILLALLASSAVWVLLLVATKIKQLLVEEWWRPLLYKPEDRRRRERRRRFADHIESEIRRLNRLEEWSDYRFTELEAEVEAEGRRREFAMIPFVNRTHSGLRREASLSQALGSSDERLILLEGEPGSGKSVALRYVARTMAHRAMKTRSAKTVIPLYVNLRELERTEGEEIDSALIRSVVLRCLNRANDRDVEEFLEDEFERGLEEGIWLFLFDSFDELPEILSSTEADQSIRAYADAVSSFLHGMNRCRGVIASREFRGPGAFGWPRFRIVPLSETRRFELVERADLDGEMERELIGNLAAATDEIRAMSSNPMFLGLLCEHVRGGHPFPENVHSVFETYVTHRLARDSQRLRRRFNLQPAEVRAAADTIAFCMAADSGLGLSPSREELQYALIRQGFEPQPRFHTVLDALEYIKLARSETATAPGESKPFTFAHRRFQEYFATCVVLREPDRLSPSQLLRDARWRETAVTMCQTQPTPVVSALLDEARGVLRDLTQRVEGLIEDPLEYVAVHAPTDGEREQTREGPPPEPFAWPPPALHILSVLQDGFSSRVETIPNDIRQEVGRLVLCATVRGTLLDAKWALAVAGTAPRPVLVYVLRCAVGGRSQWLKDVAYRQAGRLAQIPGDIASSIRQAVVGLSVAGRLRRERRATEAHLARLDKSPQFLSVVRLMTWAPYVDVFLHGLLLVALIVSSGPQTTISARHALVGSIALLASYFSMRYMACMYEPFSSYVSLYPPFNALLGCAVLLARLWANRMISELPQGEYSSGLLAWLPPYVLMWGPMALLSAGTGLYTHPLWWPILPIWPLVRFVAHARRYWLATVRVVREHWKQIIGSLLWFSLTIGSFLFALWAVVRMAERWQILRALGSAAAVAASLFMGLTLAYHAYRWAADWFRWHRWGTDLPEAITFEQLLEALVGYHGPTFRVRLLREVRERGLLDTTDATLGQIRQLAVAIETGADPVRQRARRSQSGGGDGQEDSPRSADPCRFPVQYTDKDKRRILREGTEFLDELYMIVEQHSS